MCAQYVQTYTFANNTTADGGQVNTEIVALGQSANNIVDAQISASANIGLYKTELGTGSTTNPLINNTKSYQAKTAGGVVTNLVTMDASDDMLFRAIINGSRRSDLRIETSTQSVSVSASGGTSGTPISFTRAFGTTCILLLSTAGHSTAKIDGVTASAINFTTSGFTPRVYVSAYASAETTAVHWIAIGY